MFGGGKNHNCSLEHFPFEAPLNVPKGENLDKFLDLPRLVCWPCHESLELEIKQNWGSWRVWAEIHCMEEIPREKGSQFLVTHRLYARSDSPSLGLSWLW